MKALELISSWLQALLVWVFVVLVMTLCAVLWLARPVVGLARWLARGLARR